ncbi:F-type H+-transporting ATPase subunit gamma [Thalassospira sp. MBR-102]|jgi:F-type H+-transporting ATPase subunit gamma|uniref:ATP synthase gamma chain n=2 Tax=Thalassospira xiamenensis TaxID=220697 RepID=A0ABR5Y2K1_9PROT|nr:MULTISPECIES: F0F1 ATP synthase subunit gamma [Thalassospira]MBR9780033.1 F0F1 ATP synthase subunit gamma [Rhodospirillales bacterium]AJD50411.1 F0F1 ATP synthase subunit gamma [Thalassospira xiamenensis M-5 = DSM 17429]KZD03627.1 ATP synthase F0F1 subunit gamma [Thalassospira xiamenensis]KZD08659.1 ATP synthase F0F1 subunit gamma [Thalassospira xiamenensis]MAB35138.1 F0F1 ATP synthase subunit gamma [Thalassospira sp.]|tara:strand:+ start:2806 stop:3696 length:891 start_codon:yes stop_codon:yes gene_type:complete
MASLKDLRSRIASVKSTKKITSAMKMVAASKLRRSQDAAEAARPYADRMGTMLGRLAAAVGGAQGAPKLLAGTGKDDVHLLVVFTADRGLCGGFNASIIKATRIKVRALRAAGKTVKLICVGRKGADALKREFGDAIVARYTGVEGKKGIDFSAATDVADKVLALYEEGEFDVCSIFYNKFVSAISQVVTEQQLVPFAVPEADGQEEATGSSAVYEYEPSEEAILADLLPRNVGVQIFGAMLESSASEHGARMSAMDNATRNAGDMIDRLSIQYNRSRQAQITNELIEIISGAEAL